ncbi:PEST proteolytic signal-containing nuclear protein-like [Ostrinia furnacalis]|uniref:PEST proteolytic signal-containing nuclear protein-like n=1 Tax=Ostrinia furnacalis TaxID=93504 RepID=UPI00103FB1F3|nr:PEST proteolytic signal-containing nuclear protein-like [Ostrinia furnacalis]
MTDRYSDYKGSSRSTRDDSRTHRESGRDGRDRRRSRSRSRSPRRRYSPEPRGSRYTPERSSKSRDKDERYDDKRHPQRSNDWEDSDEEVPAPPPPPRITKISIGFSKPKEPIKMTLGGAPKPNMGIKKPTVASVFNTDDDDEPEEMPAEARMRMRNIGRETPTSAGPNSFGKTKQGFCDAKKVFEKNLKEALETNNDKAVPKFPQTIYKIKGP